MRLIINFIYPMSFAIKQGLFKLNITDNHAILGVSLDAEPKQIRLKYLKIAQKLHPDKCRQDSQKAKLAGELLSKLVNPAYENLSRKTSFAEHQLVLTQVGKRLAENKAKVTVKSEVAQELLKAGGSVELVYPKLLKKLTAEQYKSLDRVLDRIAEVSELNLIYLMQKCDRVGNSPTVNSNQQTSKSNSTQKINKQTTSQSKSTISQAQAAKTQPEAKTEEPTAESRVNAFVGRAQQYIAKAEFDQAISELRDALRIDPNHGLAHAVMGKAYLHNKQLTMAKVHINKAYKADPHNATVMETKKLLDRLTQKASRSGKNQSKSSDKPTQSGFFSGFFGSKKK